MKEQIRKKPTTAVDEDDKSVDNYSSSVENHEGNDEENGTTKLNRMMGARTQQFHVFCEETSIGGIGEWKRAHRLRPLWLVVFLAFFVITVVQIHALLVDFIDNPYITLSTTETLQNITVPKSMVCALNAIFSNNAYRFFSAKHRLYLRCIPT